MHSKVLDTRWNATVPQDPEYQGEGAVTSGSDNMADRVYAHLKAAIFALRLLPGERFSENERNNFV